MLPNVRAHLRHHPQLPLRERKPAVLRGLGLFLPLLVRNGALLREGRGVSD